MSCAVQSQKGVVGGGNSGPTIRRVSYGDMILSRVFTFVAAKVQCIFGYIIDKHVSANSM
jgi:hypothetical protein